MAYVIYEKESTRIVRLRIDRADHFVTLSGAKRSMMAIAKKNGKPVDFYDIAPTEEYHKNIEKMVERTNLMSGMKYMESVNTPNYCSPASEAYWSM